MDTTSFADALARGAGAARGAPADRADALGGAGGPLAGSAGDRARIRSSTAMVRLWRQAARARSLGSGMVAVTGSVGKTGTKEALLPRPVRAQGETHASGGLLQQPLGRAR